MERVLSTVTLFPCIAIAIKMDFVCRVSKIQHSVNMFQGLTAFPPSVKEEWKHLLTLGCYIQQNVVRMNRSNQYKGEVDAEFCL